MRRVDDQPDAVADAPRHGLGSVDDEARFAGREHAQLDAAAEEDALHDSGAGTGIGTGIGRGRRQ